MTDHAGPRHCEDHPGTKFWHPPIEVTQFWQPRSGFGARSRFERQKNRMKQNSNLNHFSLCRGPALWTVIYRKCQSWKHTLFHKSLHLL